MDEQLQSFINNYLYLSDLRNVDKTNPITFELEPDHRTFLMVSSFDEPTFSQLPYNVLWLVYDQNDPWYGKVYRRVSHTDADGRKNTWEEVTTYDMLYDTDQYYQAVSDVNAFDLGIEGEFSLSAATTIKAGYVQIAEDPASGDPTVVTLDYPGFLGARTPTAHTHPDFPRTMVHIDGSYTEDENYGDLVGDTDTFVSFDYAQIPEAGAVFFLTGNNPQRTNEWYGEWRVPTTDDVTYVIPDLISVDIRISGNATEFGDNTTGQLEADGVFDDNSRDINPAELVWSIEPNAEGITVDQNGLVTIPDINADATITVYADLEDKYNMGNGDIVRGLIVISVKDLYQEVIPQSLDIIGAATQAEQTTGNYIFRVTYSDASTQDITPDAANSSDAAATLGLNGDLTAVDVSNDTPTTLTASATVDGVLLNATLPVTIIAEVIPVSLTINGLTTAQENGLYNYSFVVTFSDGSTQGLSNVDGATSSDTNTGTFATNGELTTLDIASDTTITIGASATVAGVSLSDTLEVTVVADAVPASIEILGASTINEGDTESYTFRVTYSDASTAMKVIGDLDSFVSDNGDLVVAGADATVGSITVDDTGVLTVEYTELGATVTDTHTVTMVADPIPQTLTILGATTINEGGVETYTFQVTMSDASTKMVTVAQLDSFVSDDVNAVVAAANVTIGSISADGSAILTAEYTEDGVTINDTHTIGYVANPAPQSLAILGAATVIEGGQVSYTFQVTYTDASTQTVTVTDFAANNGAVTISNTSVVDANSISTDTVVELSASYTEDGVTVNDTHDLTVTALPEPVSMEILGADSMNEQSSETYTFEVTMSDTSKKLVSVTDFASNDLGKATVANNDTVNSEDIANDTTVGVTASYTEQGVTVNGSKTINLVADVVPVSMEIIGAASVDEESTTAYTFRITMNDASTKDVTATTASADKGTFNTVGSFVAPTVTGPDTAVLSASYTESGVTVNDTHNVSIANTLNPLVSIALSGSATIAEGGNTDALTVIATFEDGSTSNVTGSSTYQITAGGSFGSVAGSTFTSGTVSSDRVVAIRATYTIGGVTRTSDHNITVTDVPPVPVSVEITGATEVDEGQNTNLTATVTYDDASTAIVSASGTWSFQGGNGGASIGSTGILTAPADVGSDTPVTVHFSFTAEGATVTDTHAVTIKDIPVSGLQAAWGYDETGADVWPYTQAFIEALPNKLSSPVLGQTLSLGPTGGHFYIAIPASEVAAGKALFYHYNGSAQFSIWGGARWPDVGFFGSSQPAVINIAGDDWHIYRTDLAGLGGPDNYDLVESNMPAS